MIRVTLIRLYSAWTLSYLTEITNYTAYLHKRPGLSEWREEFDHPSWLMTIMTSRSVSSNDLQFSGVKDTFHHKIQNNISISSEMELIFITNQIILDVLTHDLEVKLWKCSLCNFIIFWYENYSWCLHSENTKLQSWIPPVRSGRECSNILFNSKRFCLKVEGGVRKLSAGRKQREEGGDRRVISLPVTPTEGDYLNINTNQYLIFLSESKTFSLDCYKVWPEFSFKRWQDQI